MTHRQADDLTDEQCDAFRRTLGSFNDMVRTIYRAGFNRATCHRPYLPGVDSLLDDAVAEAIRAQGLHPSSKHLLLALQEESGEVVKEVMDHVFGVRPDKRQPTLADVRKELVQTIAMCIRVALEGDPTLPLFSCIDATKEAA